VGRDLAHPKVLAWRPLCLFTKILDGQHFKTICQKICEIQVVKCILHLKYIYEVLLSMLQVRPDLFVRHIYAEKDSQRFMHKSYVTTT